MNFRLLVFLLLLSSIAMAQPQTHRGPSTPEERARAVKVAHSLEADPLSPSLRSDREWLLLWLIEIPDITVSLCSPSFPYENKYKYSSDLIAVASASMAASKIEHPETANDAVAVGQSGLEAVLHAYSKILEDQPKAHSKKLDEWLAHQKDGTLPALFKKSWQETCKK